MNKPRNEDNYLVEITPEILSELYQLYMHSDVDPIVEMYYSPYWKENKVEESES